MVCTIALSPSSWVPSLASDIEELYYDEVFPPEVAKRFVFQVALEFKYLHERNVVHRGNVCIPVVMICVIIKWYVDLHLGNILLYSPKMAAWSTQIHVEKYLGKPRQGQLELHETARGTAAPATPHAPTYAVSAPDPTLLLKLCFEANVNQAVNVKICDFSESFIFLGQHQHSVGIPRFYRPPEALFDSHASSLFPTPAFNI